MKIVLNLFQSYADLNASKTTSRRIKSIKVFQSYADLNASKTQRTTTKNQNQFQSYADLNASKTSNTNLLGVIEFQSYADLNASKTDVVVLSRTGSFQSYADLNTTLEKQPCTYRKRISVKAVFHMSGRKYLFSFTIDNRYFAVQSVADIKVSALKWKKDRWRRNV